MTNEQTHTTLTERMVPGVYVTNEEIVREVSLQSIQSLWKIWAISIIVGTATGKPHHASIPCIASKKNWNTMEDKGKTVMRVLYMLRLM